MKKIIKEYGPYVLVILLILILKMFVVTTVKVNGSSMYPTLRDKDIMILNKIKYKYSDIGRFDIVVVQSDNKKIIKRIIGLPNEKITYKDNALYINDVLIEDQYNMIDQYDFEVMLGSDEYFVMGDNRANSRDSRMIGAIHKSQILGNASLTIFPFNRFGEK